MSDSWYTDPNPSNCVGRGRRAGRFVGWDHRFRPAGPPPPWAGGNVVLRAETPESIQRYVAQNFPPGHPLLAGRTPPQSESPASPAVPDASFVLPRAVDYAKPYVPAVDPALEARRAEEEKAELRRLRRAEREARARRRLEADQAALRLARHQAKCIVCRHPQRAAIERDFVDWLAPSKLAELYNLGSERSVYRHAHFFSLFDRRLSNHQMALGCLIEHAHDVKPTAAAIVSAVRLSADLKRRHIRTLRDSQLFNESQSAPYASLPAQTTNPPRQSPQPPSGLRTLWTKLKSGLGKHTKF